MTSEFYSNYFDSSAFFYNSSAYFIFKKSSNFSSSSKSVFFVSIFSQSIQFRQSDIQKLKNCLFHFQQTMKQIINQNVNHNIISTINTFNENKIRQIEKARLVRKRAKKQQIKQTRIIETTRFVKKYRFFAKRQINEIRLAEQIRIEIEKIRLIKKRAKRLLHHQIEKTRLVKKRTKQQQIEQIRIAKKQKEIRLTTFACKRCNAKFSNNIKFHNHMQNHYQKKFATKFAMFSSFNFITSSELVKITINEFAKITSIAIFASMSTFFFTSKTMIMMFTSFAIFFLSNESALMFTTFVHQSKSIFDNSRLMTSFATSKKSIFWIKIVSRSIIASKLSRFSIATFKCKKLKIQNLRNEFRLRNEFVKNSNQTNSKYQIDYIMKSTISLY